MIAIPDEAYAAQRALEEVFGGSLRGIYLYGSATLGGLHGESDVDVLALTARPIADGERHELTARLLAVSGRVGNAQGVHPLEITVIDAGAIAEFPPRYEYQYGEWLRAGIEAGDEPMSGSDPDIAILLWQVRGHSLPLAGPRADALIPPVPARDVCRAIEGALPGLMDWLIGDERNVLLTLARMWYTVCTGQIASKDAAAAWAVERLEGEQARTGAQCEAARLMDIARRAYLGECRDEWRGCERETQRAAEELRARIERELAHHI